MNFLRKNRKIIIISLGALVIIGSAITFFVLNKDENEIKEKNNEPIVESTEELSIIDVDSTTRPYAVMVNNHSDVRPYHSGLQDAYIIYEIVVESGISRYMALYKDVETTRIAGVRSARHYYLDYAMENDAFFIHWGSSPQARSDMNILDVDTFEVGEDHYAFRDYSLPVATEHKTYTSIEELNSAIATTNYREETNQDLLLNYSVNSIDMNHLDGSEKTNEIDIYYSSSNISSFSYNEETKSYMHSVNNKSHDDYITGEQYHFKNIITYQVNNYTLDDPENEGRQGLENVGSGTGYLITEGYRVPIKWEKDSRESQTIYTYMDGTEIKVNDGNTYIAIQPEGQKLILS